MTDAMAAAGARILGGRYALREVLGTGGMATVWRATDDVLGRDVAVKVLNSEYAADVSFLDRFKREARNVAALSNSRIVTVFDWGLDDTTPYIVMELLAGKTLRQLLDEAVTLPVRQAITIAAAVCDALEAAHAAGLVHRDVKPANIALSGREVKVLDFGIARTEVPGATRTQAVLGTAAYLSPEQASGEAVGPQADLYSLGCVLFEMLTGTPPFTADSEVGVAYRQVHDDPGPPSARRSGLPGKLDEVVRQLLAKNPADRPAGAAAARAALLSVLARDPRDPRDKTAVLSRSGTGPLGAQPRGLTPAPPRRLADLRQSEAVLAMSLIAALAALVVVLLTSGPAAKLGAAPKSGHIAAHQQHPKSPAAGSGSGTPAARRFTGLPPAAMAAGALVGNLQAGVADGQVTQEAGQNLFNQLQQVLFQAAGNAQQREQQYAQLVEAYDQYRSRGQITGASAAALRRAIRDLGTALGAG